MGFILTKKDIDALFDELKIGSFLYGPKRYAGQGEFSDTDSIRYGDISNIDELELVEKSSHTYKEILMPISETLFYYTEDEVKEAEAANSREALVFVRSCDMHSIKRLDNIYLNNGFGDYYYSRLRDKIKFVLIGCSEAYENCFCVDMQTNKSDNYAMSIDMIDGKYHMDVKDESLLAVFEKFNFDEAKVEPLYVTETQTRVDIPNDIDILEINEHDMWREYDRRCIACGRCNFSCPTCSCYTMQDIFYTDNGKVGERRRVWASCMVDGYTDVAGGGAYRKKNGQRMRFKVLHKVYDYKRRFKDTHMCTGCGRCDDVCPEYISFSNAINKLSKTVKGGK